MRSLRPTLGILGLGSMLACAAADQLLLSDGSLLSGKLRGITNDGKVQMELAVATEPVDFRVSQVEKVRFESRPTREGSHDTQLLLTNGDVVPCDLESIDAATLKVSTFYAGEFEIPRQAVTAAQFGISPRALVYAGPEDLTGWKVENGWHFENGALVSTGRGTIHRKIDKLPPSFSLSFRLEWARSPNVQVFFCSTAAQTGGTTDRYYLQMNSAGLELKRQSSEGKSYRSLGSIDRSPDTFANHSVDIEIRADHRQRAILLYIDGELEDTYPDPLANMPTGDLVLFHSNSSEEKGHRISQIRIREWDAQSERHRNEDRGDLSQDSLIDHEGQRFGGNLIGTRGVGTGMHVLFKSPHFPEALEIPASNVSTVFFQSTPNDKDGSATPLVIGLAGGGSLSTTTSLIDDNEILVDHPLLGRMHLDRNAATSLERRKNPEPEDDE